MRIHHGILAGVLLGLAVSPVSASTPYMAKMKCPVGGKSFEYLSTASYSTWGSRLDGKPYGSWEFPNPLPICPDNGLVVFDEFSKEQIAVLKAAIAEQDYRAMSDRDTPYYRAHWLSRKLGRDAMDTAWLLVQASWEADPDPTLKARYQREYVDEIRAIPQPQDPQVWTIMQLRAANGLRELGRFEDAQALLASLPLSQFDVAVPEEQVAGSTASGLGKIVTNWEAIRAAKRKRSFLVYAEDLRALIAEKNASSEPLRLMPLREAVLRCQSKRDQLTGSDAELCASEPVRKAMKD